MAEAVSQEKSLTKNSLFYLFYNALNVIFPFIAGIYVARVLLPANIGQVESARNLAQYFVILAFLGIPTYGLREIAKARKDKVALNKLYSELIAINSISTAIFAIIYYAIVLAVPYYHDNLNLYLISGISIVLNFLNNAWLFEGLEEFKFISLRNLIIKALSFVLLVIFVRKPEDYVWYLVITVFGVAGNYFLNVIKARKVVHLSFHDLNLKRHMKSIMFLVVINLAIEIYSLVDVTMLGAMCNGENVAHYVYGQKVYIVFLQIINTFTMVLVPRISIYFKEKRKEEFNDVVTKVLKVIWLLAVPLILGIWFVSDYLMCALYTDAYLSSATVLKILSFILVISPTGYLLGSRMLLVTGHENLMVIPVASGAVVNVLANLLLIPIMQEQGAALASVIGEVVVCVIYIILGRKYYKLNNITSSLYKEVIALAVMAGFLVGIYYLPIDRLWVTIIQIIGAMIIYFGLLILFKEDITYRSFDKIKRKVFAHGK